MSLDSTLTHSKASSLQVTFATVQTRSCGQCVIDEYTVKQITRCGGSAGTTLNMKSQAVLDAIADMNIGIVQESRL